MSTCGLVAMTSASHAEGRQVNPGQVYDSSHASSCSPHRLSGNWDAVETTEFLDLVIKLTRKSFAGTKENTAAEVQKSPVHQNIGF